MKPYLSIDCYCDNSEMIMTTCIIFGMLAMECEDLGKYAVFDFKLMSWRTTEVTYLSPRINKETYIKSKVISLIYYNFRLALLSQGSCFQDCKC